MSDFKKTRAAASALSKDRKALATALAEEIPSQKRGGAADREALVQTELEKAAALLAEDGHDFAVSTLANYRDTALWVGGGNSPSGGDWTDGSFTLHKEAFSAGMTKRAFLAWYAKTDKHTVDALRKKQGRPQTNTGKLAEGLASAGQIEKAIAALPAEQKEAIVHSFVESGALGAAIQASPELRDEVAVEVDKTRTGRDERTRRAITAAPGKGTTEVREFIDRARYEVNRGTEMLVKMHLNTRVDLDKDDAFDLLRNACADLGRAIFEFEGALGDTIITERIVGLRAPEEVLDPTDPREVGR